MNDRDTIDNEPIEVGVMVVLTVPRRMVASVEKELATCIGFGKPVITTIYDVPAARPVDDLPALLQPATMYSPVRHATGQG